MIKKLILVGFALFSYGLNAQDVTVKTLEMHSGAFVIKTNGDVNANPNLVVKDKVVEVMIPNAHVNGKIEKNINQVNLTATQVDRSTVKVTATFSKSLQGKESLINITLKDSAIEVNFPKTLAGAASKVSRTPEMIASAPEVSDGKDEADLRKLESEQENTVAKTEPETTTQKDIFNKDQKEDKKIAQLDTDRVTVAQSSVTKAPAIAPKSSFSIAGYVGKFVAFLSLMILGFYGVLTLFKKGVIKKGRLGFLHSTKLVEVLSTTHVAPKRTLMMVKAHKQVFLISSSETGMQLISEIQDVAGLIKTGEEELTGTNFDTNMIEANKTDREFKLKEVKDIRTDEVDYASLDELLNEEPPAAAKSIAKSPVKDEVRLSDQIKTKLKNLKQLQ